MTNKQEWKYKALIYFIREYKTKFSLLLLLSIMVSAAEVCQLAALFPVLNRLLPSLSPTTVPGLKFLELIVNSLPTRDPLVSSVFVLGITIMVRFTFVFFNDLLNQTYTADIVCDMKRKTFCRIFKSNYQFFLNRKQSDLFFVTIDAAERVGAYLSYFVLAVVQILSILSVVFFLFYVNAVTTLAIMLLAVVYYAITREISTRVSYVGGKKRVELLKMQHSIVREFLNGVKYFFVFRKQFVIDRLFRRNLEMYQRQYLRDSFWQVFLQKIPEPTLLLIICCAIAFIASETNGKSINNYLNVIGVFFFGIQRIVPALNKFSGSRIQVLTGLPNMEICQAFLTEKAEADKDGSIKFGSFENKITFNQVDLSYTPDRKVLDKVNLEFKKLQMTAIVGKSGSGKTSIINLILRLFRCSSGSIEIDGIDINQISIASFLDQVGYVGQETFLFHGTVEDNIKFFNDTYTHDQVENAAKIANAHDFINAMPKKYDTIIGDQGMKLSGGQRQRLAIARALVRQPKILILDEATSSLDSISESIVQNTISSISKVYTVIVVAHKLSTIINADNIYVLDSGRVVESGRHSDLIMKRGRYYQLNQGSLNERDSKKIE